MADSKGIQRGARLKNRNGKQRLVGLDAQGADEWLAGEKEKNTCEHPGPVAPFNRRCLYAPIKLAFQESDGIICRKGKDGSAVPGKTRNGQCSDLARGLLYFSA